MIYMTTTYKPMLGYEEKYHCYADGRIWSVGSNKFLSCKPNAARGYKEFSIYISGGRKNRKSTTKQVHQEIWRAYNGPYPSTMQIRHLDGNKLNNNLDNLLVGTAQDNVDDRRHREYLGKKLADAEQIKTINELIDSGLAAHEVAEKLDISLAQVYTYSANRPKVLQSKDMLACVKAGAKVVLIAKYFGVTHAAVCSALKHLGTPVRQLRREYPLNRKLTLEDISYIIAG